jgi:DNA primase
MISERVIDEVRNQMRIEEVVGKFVELKKTGSSYKALSPFSNEKTPSFTVTPSKGIYKCFSTGKGGDSISFLQEHEKLTFTEAIEWLADFYNVSLEENEKDTRVAEEKASIVAVNEFAAKFFMNVLSPEVMSYMDRRGYEQQILDKFEIGYAPDTWELLKEEAVGKGFDLEVLVKADLIKFKKEKHYDTFRGRIMFPIRSVSGQVLGFGGRAFKEQTAKYVNSAESPVYNKSFCLYGLYQAKKAILEHDECYVVEGYTDVMTMHVYGMENVVSSSGTSLTQGQVKMIKRYTKNVVLMYDGDAAGIKATRRGIDLLHTEGMNVKVVPFEEGVDPGGFVGSLSKYVEKKKTNFLEYLIGVTKYLEVTDIFDRIKIGKEIMAHVNIIPDKLTRDMYKAFAQQDLNVRPPEEGDVVEEAKDEPVEPIAPIVAQSYVEVFLEWFSSAKHGVFIKGDFEITVYEYVCYVLRVNMIRIDCGDEVEFDVDLKVEDVDRNVSLLLHEVTSETLVTINKEIKSSEDDDLKRVFEERKFYSELLKRPR